MVNRVLLFIHIWYGSGEIGLRHEDTEYAILSLDVIFVHLETGLVKSWIISFTNLGVIFTGTCIHFCGVVTYYGTLRLHVLI